MNTSKTDSTDNWKTTGEVCLTILILLMVSACIIIIVVVYRVRHGLPLTYATYEFEHNRSSGSGIQGLRNPVYDVDYNF